jgi:hypothetical protein
MMVEVKQMPYEEKYSGVLGYMKMLEGFTLPLVKENLGDQKVEELKKIWQEELKPVPEDASYEEKNEIAYGNWLRNWQSAYSFVLKNMGESGAEKFKHAAVEGLIKKNSSPALLMLNFMRAISPGTAFKTLAKQMTYQLQVFSPLSVSELTSQKLVMDTSNCKALNYPDSKDFCLVGCQVISPIWVKEQFKVNMTVNRQGKNCTVSLIP